MGSTTERDQATRLAASVWAALAADTATVAAYHRRVYRRPGKCWYWLGAISDGGQAKLRVPGSTRVIAAPVLGWHLTRGALQPGPDGRLPVLRHTCDEASCQNPAHWILGTRRDNAADYQARKRDPFSPLNDLRGPGRRARAIRDAIKLARATGADDRGIEREIGRAIAVGSPGVAGTLF